METTEAKLQALQAKLERSGEEEGGLMAECEVGGRRLDHLDLDCTDFYPSKEQHSLSSLIMKSCKLISASSANFSYDNRDSGSLINHNMCHFPPTEPIINFSMTLAGLQC